MCSEEDTLQEKKYNIVVKTTIRCLLNDLITLNIITVNEERDLEEKYIAKFCNARD